MAAASSSSHNKNINSRQQSSCVREAKPKCCRSYEVYAKQSTKKPPAARKPREHSPDLDYAQPAAIGSVQVLTQPRRAHDTPDSFFVPLLQQAAPRDFQLLRPAGQRYRQKLQRDRRASERSRAEMRELAAATRTLLPQWLPLDEVVPPPPQFADSDKEPNAWRYRINRTDTVTLCNFPTLERQLLVREYAGHLQP